MVTASVLRPTHAQAASVSTTVLASSTSASLAVIAFVWHHVCTDARACSCSHAHVCLCGVLQQLHQHRLHPPRLAAVRSTATVVQTSIARQDACARRVSFVLRWETQSTARHVQHAQVWVLRLHLSLPHSLTVLCACLLAFSHVDHGAVW